jgi:hypothetical protein
MKAGRLYEKGREELRKIKILKKVGDKRICEPLLSQ